MKGFFLRKLLHFFSIIFPISIILFDKKIYLSISAFFLGGFLTADYLRFEIKSFSKFFWSFFGELTKTHERRFLTGATWVCFSVFLIESIFPEKIALITLLFLSISDNLASVCGKLLGRTKIINEKTLEGTFIYLLSSFIITLFFPELSILKKLIISFSSTLFELFSYRIDDNITVPILTAILLWILI